MDLKEQLVRDEGIRLVPYKDDLGYWTVGVGRLIDGRKTQQAFSRAEVFYLLDNDIKSKTEEILRVLPWVGDMDVVRQAVLLNMAFNLGIGGLLKFKKFLAACELKDWLTAGVEMEDSKWWKQVGNRSKRLRQQLLTGEWV